MRVNCYAEELTQRVELVEKAGFVGVRFYLELPVRKRISDLQPERGYEEHRGPFIHHDGDDDSSAVTFWGKRELRGLLTQALALLDAYYTRRA